MQEVEEAVKTELSYVKIFDDAAPSGGSQVRRATNKIVPLDVFNPPPLTMRLLKDYVKQHPTMCLGCYQEKPAHFEKGCPTCASAGWYVVKDAEQSKEVLQTLPRPDGGRGRGRGRGGGHSGRGGRGGRSNANRATEEKSEDSPTQQQPTDDKDTNSQASANRALAQRATDSDISGPRQYVDAFMEQFSSDEENVSGFDSRLSNNSKNNTASSSY